MNLDDVSSFSQIDLQDMLSEIDGLPDQLLSAWELGQALPLPKWNGIKQVLIAGMGSMAVGADLLVAYVSQACPLPIFINRAYDLPAWAGGPETLVVALSHSGDTEEIISAFEQAAAKGCRILAICTGGELARAASSAGAAVWQFSHQGRANNALGYSFGLLLAAFSRLGWIADPEVDLTTSVAAMKAQQETLRAKVPVMLNPAKRLAGQCLGRWVVVVGADILEAVARHWKSQINLIAKAWAQCEFLPDADHHTLAGVIFPENVITHTFVIFLQSLANHPRDQLRVRMTKEIMMLEGVGTDFVVTAGDTPLAQMWTLVHFGDYFAYYLAMLYGVDPASIEIIEGLEDWLKQS